MRHGICNIYTIEYLLIIVWRARGDLSGLGITMSNLEPEQIPVPPQLCISQSPLHRRSETSSKVNYTVLRFTEISVVQTCFTGLYNKVIYRKVILKGPAVWPCG